METAKRTPSAFSLVVLLAAFAVLCALLGPTPSMASDVAAAASSSPAAADINYTQEELGGDSTYKEGDPEEVTPSSPSSSSLRRFLQSNHPRLRVTCDWYPKICRARGGGRRRSCCRRRCVDLKSDYLNCGRCGRRCRYGEACCGGTCVNVLFDPKNCGWCNRKCRNGARCRYGMCSYAGGRRHRH